MVVRRRQVDAGRRVMVEAAIWLLELDGYRRRLGGFDEAAAAERRRAVEAALSPDEMAVVDRVTDDDYRINASVVEYLDRHVGGVEPTVGEVIEAQTEMLGRRPVRGG
jgi:hypothetical protein